MIWKVLTLVFATGCVTLLLLLVRNQPAPALHDPRLYGTWISDRERTLNALDPSTSDERREKLEKLFGKLKVTYTESTISSELDDFVETTPYTVLGLDEHSVVIRDDSPPDPVMADFNLSSFYRIKFESADTYWITTEIGGFTEYFKRVSHGGQ